GRPRNLDPRATEQRDRGAGDDRGIQALLRLHPGGDRERHRQRQRDHADDQAGDDVPRPVRALEQPRAPGFDRGDHGCRSAGSLSRTPRPLPVLAAPSPISSTPAPSSASTTFTSESTVPRTWPALASIRWIVGKDSPASCARARWSRPSKALAARICGAVIMRILKDTTCLCMSETTVSGYDTPASIGFVQ